MDTSSNLILSRWFDPLPAQCDGDRAADHGNGTQRGPGVELFLIPKEQIGDHQIPQRRGRNYRRNHHHSTYSESHQAQQGAQALEKTGRREMHQRFRVPDDTLIAVRYPSIRQRAHQRHDCDDGCEEYRLVGNRQPITAERKSDAGENSRAERVKNVPPAVVDRFRIRLPGD